MGPSWSSPRDNSGGGEGLYFVLARARARVCVWYIFFLPHTRPLSLSHAPTRSHTQTQVVFPEGQWRFNLSQIVTFITRSPGLWTELQRLRIARLPVAQRELWMKEVTVLRMAAKEAQRENHREETQMVLAVEYFRLKIECKAFHALKRYARDSIREDLAINSLRARRFVHRLAMASRVTRIDNAQVNLAEAHYAKTFATSFFQAWRSITELHKEEREAAMVKAGAWSHSALTTRVFRGWSA